MSALFYLAIGFIVGLFIPSPIDSLIKGWLSAAWEKIKSIFNKGGTA
jgi:hypothetical protein